MDTNNLRPSQAMKWLKHPLTVKEKKERKTASSKKSYRQRQHQGLNRHPR